MKNELFFSKFGDYLKSLNGESEEDIARSNYEHQCRYREKQMHDSWLNVLGSLAKFLSSFSK